MPFGKNKIDASLKDVKNYLKKFEKISRQPISLEIIDTAFSILDIPELHDRIISAGAIGEGIEIITNDPEIRASKFVKTIWD